MSRLRSPQNLTTEIAFGAALLAREPITESEHRALTAKAAQEYLPDAHVEMVRELVEQGFQALGLVEG